MFKCFSLDRQTASEKEWFKVSKICIYTAYIHRISICLYINVL
jgi:hypothetical protein